MLRASLICTECVIKAALQKHQPNTEKAATSFDGLREQMHFEVIVCLSVLVNVGFTCANTHRRSHTHAHKTELDISQQIVVDKQKSGPSTTFIHTHSFVEFIGPQTTTNIRASTHAHIPAAQK